MAPLECSNLYCIVWTYFIFANKLIAETFCIHSEPNLKNAFSSYFLLLMLFGGQKMTSLSPMSFLRSTDP